MLIKKNVQISDELRRSFTKELRKKACLDAILGIFVIIIMTVLSLLLSFEPFEYFYNISREHESWQLDEMLLIAVWVGLVALVFGARRLNDIKQLNSHIVQLAYFDSLTGLPNRTQAILSLDAAIKAARKNDTSLAIMFVDFDNFKQINDTYGHDTGDLLIESVGSRLSKLFDINNAAFRLSGDEFLVLLPNVKSKQAIQTHIDKIIKTHRDPHNVGDLQLFVEFSVGVARYPEDASDSRGLLKAADVAMYYVKQHGRDKHYHYYSEDEDVALKKRYRIERALKQVVDSDGDDIRLVYQPQYDAGKDAIIGFEVLSRWRFNDEDISPDFFISVAENKGLIIGFGRQVLRRACADATKWKNTSMNLSVNISVIQLMSPNFYDDLLEILENTGFDSNRLELEVTETSLITEEKTIKSLLTSIRRLGIKVSIDDFGKGHSSLSRLNQLSADKIKIDKGFVIGKKGDALSTMLIQSIIQVADVMQVDIIAEGVETEREYKWLKSMGCTIFQGFYISDAIETDKIDDWLTTFSSPSSEQ